MKINKCFYNVLLIHHAIKKINHLNIVLKKEFQTNVRLSDMTIIYVKDQ
jgi:hypothetical protein